MWAGLIIFYRCITYKFELYLSLSVKIPVMSSERDEFQTVEDVASSEVYQCNHELHDTDKHVTLSLSSELKYTILYGVLIIFVVGSGQARVSSSPATTVSDMAS